LGERTTNTGRRGAAYGLTAAILFGVSAPISKLLLPSISPLMLAGLLYLGGGLALAAFGVVRQSSVQREARLRRADLLPMLGVIALGGIFGPLLMLLGLERTSATIGSLMLNLEAPLTMALAVLLFREHLGRREWMASLAVVAGAAVLGVHSSEVRAERLGLISLAGACLCWAVDNNLTQQLSLRDPVQLVRTKALGAGACSLLIALLSGETLPSIRLVAAAVCLGACSYGISIVLDMYALRLLGAAREAAFFATAPFIGALAAVPLTGARLGPREIGAGLLMVLGVAGLLRERHGHVHTHEPLEHDHLHVHDEHHQHPHEGPVSEPHSHPHVHAPITHTHPHVSDVHHRHRHW
jgi:drug/metabolite transporter (DMT)-like permease